MGTANLEWLRSNALLLRIVQRLGGVLAVTLGAFVALWILRLLATRMVARYAEPLPDGSPGTTDRDERRRRVETVVGVGKDVSRVFILGFAVLTILSQFGVSVQPLVAGAGLIGAAVAFGSQAIVKDYASGFFILLENHFGLGDVVTVGAVTGTVEKMTLRVTVLRDADGSIHILPNGAIAVVTNKSNKWNNAKVLFTVDPNADPEIVRAALVKVADQLQAEATYRALWIENIVVAGPLALRELGVEWAVSAKVPVGKAGEAVPLLLERAQRALIQAEVKLSTRGA
jgi:moderate conductance mechanosensitive channel